MAVMEQLLQGLAMLRRIDSGIMAFLETLKGPYGTEITFCEGTRGGSMEMSLSVVSWMVTARELLICDEGRNG